MNIAAVNLPHIANFTDFLPLSNIDSGALNYVHTPNEIVNADVVILPGSKNTIADLHWLKAGHWARPLGQPEEHGKSLVGGCAGYQILGQEITDSLGVDGKCPDKEGLQIGPETGIFCTYEIHMGHTTVARARPLWERPHTSFSPASG